MFSGSESLLNYEGSNRKNALASQRQTINGLLVLQNKNHRKRDHRFDVDTLLTFRSSPVLCSQDPSANETFTVTCYRTEETLVCSIFEIIKAILHPPCCCYYACQVCAEYN